MHEKYKTLFAEFTEDDTFLETIYLEAISMSFDPHSLYFTPSAKKDFEEVVKYVKESNIQVVVPNQIILSNN